MVPHCCCTNLWSAPIPVQHNAPVWDVNPETHNDNDAVMIDAPLTFAVFCMLARHAFPSSLFFSRPARMRHHPGTYAQTMHQAQMYHNGSSSQAAACSNTCCRTAQDTAGQCHTSGACRCQHQHSNSSGSPASCSSCSCCGPCCQISQGQKDHSSSSYASCCTCTSCSSSSR